jgi:tetratricopeptide (TPR) repeat protein
MPRPPNIPKRKLPTPVKSAPQHNQVASLIAQGLILHQQGKFNEAKAIYQKALAIQENHIEALQLLGTLSVQTKEFTKAVDFLTKALKINPNHVACYSHLGIALKELGCFDEALASYDQAISIKPDYADAYSNRGNALQELKRFDEALASYDQATSIKPDYAEAYSNRGATLNELKRFDEALTSCNQAISIKPDYPSPYYNRGNALKELKRLDEALASYDQAIRIKPDYAEAYSNRGNALQDLRRLDKAVESYDQAINIKPDYASAHWNLSLCHLLSGNFKDGWQEYEWRWKNETLSTYKGKRSFPQPLWLGVESLKDKTILLHAEQGLGDTIQFCRYAPLVAERGAKVILEVQRSLVTLLKNIEGVSQVVAMGDALPAFDHQCPLLSLPLAFKTELHTVPPVPRQINVDLEKVAKWKAKLGEKTKPRIGLVWSGSTINKNDHNRSITLAQLLPHLPSHLQYVCLQKELRDIDKELIVGNIEIKYFGDALEDFTDTAALCELMDVVISVDTSVAHLAASLGKQTWVLLPYRPDWRWLLDRDDNPWYPTAKLYRQEKIGNWNDVLEKIKSDLEKLIN